VIPKLVQNLKEPVNQKIISEIWVYPIKSLPGVRMKSAHVMGKGLEGDRRFMLVDENNIFMTQREFPAMTQFSVSMDSGTIQVKSIAQEKLGGLVIGREQTQSENFKAVVWDDEVEVVEVDKNYSRWFSESLNTRCKLVFFPEGNARRVDTDYVKDEHHVSLADGYPFLVIGNASLNDLSNRVGASLSMKRFRPNFVVDGSGPYEEDSWKYFKVGEVEFSGVKPCGRCSIITIDPETGEKGIEPLQTLSSYRKRNGKVCFGQNVIALNKGEVKERDVITLS
jgi:uncharacterized protein